MTRAIILHGTEGSPEGNWFPWLARELAKDGIGVELPRLPTPEGQSLESWQAAFLSQIGAVEAHDILIGHSMGCGFALRLLEQSGVAIKGTFLVAGFLGALGSEHYDRLNASFFQSPFSCQALLRNAGCIRCYNGANDPYVPVEKGRELAKMLGVVAVEISGGGHLNTEFGFTTFPLLRDEVRALALL